MSDAPHSKPVRLAHAALQAAFGEKYDAMNRYLARISQECGGEGITVALMTWCDAFHAHATDGDLRPAKVRLSMIQSDTGAVATGEDLPEPAVWAKRLIAARLAMDEQAWSDAIDDVPPDQVGQYVWGVLHVVATTINGLPRGYARMGRGVA
jgi:hypothetical protein